MERRVVTMVRDRLPDTWRVAEMSEPNKGARRPDLEIEIEIEAPDGGRTRLVVDSTASLRPGLRAHSWTTAVTGGCANSSPHRAHRAVPVQRDSTTRMRTTSTASHGQLIPAYSLMRLSGCRTTT